MRSCPVRNDEFEIERCAIRISELSVNVGQTLVDNQDPVETGVVGQLRMGAIRRCDAEGGKDKNSHNTNHQCRESVHGLNDLLFYS